MPHYTWSIRLLLVLLVLLVVGCSKGDPGGTATTAKMQKISSTDGTAIELEPSPDGFPLGLSVSEGFAMHLFDTPGANQGFRKFPPESGSKRHYDEFTLVGKVHLVIRSVSSRPRAGALYPGGRRA